MHSKEEIYREIIPMVMVEQMHLEKNSLL